MGLTKPQMYTEFADGINTVFYDANSVIGLVFGEEEASARKLVEAIREQARMHAVSERSARAGDSRRFDYFFIFSQIHFYSSQRRSRRHAEALQLELF